jgi:hypothetical protein
VTGRNVFFVFLVVLGCNKAPDPSPEPTASVQPAPTASASSDSSGTRMAISKDGTRLGTLDLGARSTGMLMLKTEGEDAKALSELWSEISASGTVRVKMHVERDGRRVLGAREYKRGDADYAEGVRLKLLSEGYAVEVLP